MNLLIVKLVKTKDYSLEELLNSRFLSTSDLKAIEKYKMEETKKEKAVSFILKNKYIKDYYLNEFGKPLSKDICFNISHSHGVVIFTLYEFDVGVDIEKIRTSQDDVRRYISNDEEYAYIKDDKSFYEIWTSKESLVKALGIGIKDNIKDIPALPINGVKQYKNHEFISRNVEFEDFIISVTTLGNSDFEIKVLKEELKPL